MPSVLGELLRRLSSAMRSAGVRWYLFGAQAAIIHGAARLTADVDVTVDLGDRSPYELLDALHEEGFSLRVSDADDSVHQTRVFPMLHDRSGMPVDVVLAGPGLEEQFFARAVDVPLQGIRIPVASAEDVIVMKVLAGRPNDLADVEAILGARGDDLDMKLVESTLRMLERALDQADLLPKLEQARLAVRRR